MYFPEHVYVYKTPLENHHQVLENIYCRGRVFESVANVFGEGSVTCRHTRIQPLITQRGENEDSEESDREHM